MAIVLLRRSAMYAFTCVLVLIIQMQTFAASMEINQEHSESLERNHEVKIDGVNQDEGQNIQRRQDNGFDFMSYFMGKNAQQQPQQQPAASQQHTEQLQQQPSQIQQQHLLQQQLLQQQQQRQQEQLQQLQQQQLIQLQQHQRTPDVGYQDNTVHQQYQPQTAALNRDGYGGLGIGTGYQQGYAQEPKAIDINIGGGKPVVRVGNILTLLPRIINTLSAGGKVMFGVELGNNFYFGPVGAKPLHKLA